MDSEHGKGKTLNFSVDGSDVKNQNKRNYNRQLEYRKTSLGANKLPKAKLPGGWNRWNIGNWFRKQRSFLAEKHKPGE